MLLLCRSELSIRCFARRSVSVGVTWHLRSLIVVIATMTTSRTLAAMCHCDSFAPSREAARPRLSTLGRSPSAWHVRRAQIRQRPHDCLPVPLGVHVAGASACGHGLSTESASTCMIATCRLATACYLCWYPTHFTSTCVRAYSWGPQPPKRATGATPTRIRTHYCSDDGAASWSRRYGGYARIAWCACYTLRLHWAFHLVVGLADVTL